MSMFGTVVTLITKDWEEKGSIRCKVVPRAGEYLYLSDFGKYVVVLNVVHQTRFWSGTDIVLVVEDVTVNLTPDGRKIEE